MITDPEERFTNAMHFAAHAWKLALDRRLKNHGLSRAGWKTLAVIARAPEPLSQAAISDMVGVEGATMVSTLDRLEKSGLIQRLVSKMDRRVKLVTLTGPGQQLFNEVQSVATSARKELLAGISAAELAKATSLLEEIAAAANDIK